MDNDALSMKQQLAETLRGAESVVITTQQNPNKDAIAAAIGLHLLLEKLEKVAEVVITADIPKQLDFLPRDFINKELQGQRDFVIELDQSKTEADHLKYVTEKGKLKIYITPYNGVFSKDDVNFSYGDYHCDAIIGLGVRDVKDMATAVTKESKLTKKAKFLLINPGPSSPAGEHTINWNDPSASSVCEMIMSISEALGSGLLDEEIATALFTGIVDNTEHFTNESTTPKVMTMSAQLLAAGAKQSVVVKRLQTPDEPPKPKEDKPQQKPDSAPAKKAEDEQPQKPDNEFQIRQPASDKKPAKEVEPTKPEATTPQTTEPKTDEAASQPPQAPASPDTHQPQAPSLPEVHNPKTQTPPSGHTQVSLPPYHPASQPESQPEPKQSAAPTNMPDSLTQSQSSPSPPNQTPPASEPAAPPVSGPEPSMPSSLNNVVNPLSPTDNQPQPGQPAVTPPQTPPPTPPSPLSAATDQNAPAVPPKTTNDTGSIDMEAARKAVEEAHQASSNPPDTPPDQQTPSS